MSKKLITVLGVTGSQGGSAAERFLSHANWRVRGITRNPDSTKAKEWAKKGVEMVKADLDDIASLKTAFQGAHAIFAVTDWASSVSRVSEDKALQKKATAAGRSLEEYAGDLEMQQGINVATAASDPTVLSTLEKFVFSTLSAVKRISGGKFQHAYEFDSKAAAEQYMREKLPELNARLSTINMGIFQETWKDIPAFRPHKLSDGTFEFVQLKAPGAPLAYPEVVARRDPGVFVEALVLHHPAGTDVLGAAEIVTRGEYAAIWGRTMGVETKVRDVSEEEYAEYLPEGYKVGMLDMFLFFADHGYAGGNSKVKTPTELGIKTASLEEFIRGEDWSAVLKGEM